MKTQLTNSLKDNAAAGAVLIAMLIATVGSIATSTEANAAKVAAPAATYTMDTIVVTAKRAPVEQMDRIVVTASRLETAVN